MNRLKWLLVEWPKIIALALLNVLLSRNIHSDERPQEIFQSRLFLGFCAVVPVMLLPIVVSDAIAHGFFHPDTIQTTSLISLFVVCFILFRVFNLRETAFYLLLSGGLGLYFFDVYITGNLYSPAMIWMPIIPFAIAFYRDFRITLGIGCLFIAFVWVLWELRITGFEFPADEIGDQVDANSYLVEYISVIITAVLLAIYFRYIQNQMKKELQLQTIMYKITSDALEKNRILLKTILNTVPQEISVKDLDGRFLLVNQTFASARGKNSEDILGMNAFDLAPEQPNENEIIAQTDQEVIESAKNVELTMTRGLSEIDLRYFHVIKSPLRDKSQEIIGIVDVGIDITERVKDEQRIIVLERMAAIVQVSGGVCHTFNNINQIILINLELLDEQDQTNKRMVIQKIHNQVKLATDINNQLMTYSRKRFSVKKSIVDINQIVTPFVQNLPSRDHMSLSINFDPQPSLRNVAINPDDFEKILGHLFENAQDAMDDEGTLEIKTFNLEISDSTKKPDPEMQRGTYVGMSVTDSGCGLSSADARKVFEPFFTTKDKALHSGLGLSNVFGIVKEANGHIIIDSEQGQGTKIQIFLPSAEGNFLD